MTTSSTQRKAGPYTGDGAQSAWPFDFKVFAAADVKVVITNPAGLETTLVIEDDYTVTLNSNQDTSPGGTVTYTLADGYSLVILSGLVIDQPYDIPAGGNFNPVALENQLDRIAMQLQQLAEQVGRSLSVPTTGSASDADSILSSLWEAYSLDSITSPYIRLLTQRYSGNGTTTAFTLPQTPAIAAACDVFISGVHQVPGVDFTVSGATLTFTEAPPAGTNNVFVRVMRATVGGVNIVYE